RPVLAATRAKPLRPCAAFPRPMCRRWPIAMKIRAAVWPNHLDDRRSGASALGQQLTRQTFCPHVQLFYLGVQMRFALIIAATVFAFSAAPASAAQCDHSWQTAKDGSKCGARAADQRPGGKY